MSLDSYDTDLLLNAILDYSYDGIWITDGKANVLKINRAHERISSIKAEQVVGKSMKDLADQGLVPESVSLEVLERKETVTILQKELNGKISISTGNPVFNANGDISMVITNTRDITELNDLRRQLEEKNKELDKLSQEKLLNNMGCVHQSQKMKELLKTVSQVAKTDATVLILGESGVGKEIIAELVHGLSSRNNKEFIKINCGSIPESLFESELFGYEKGAFTGATQHGKKGLFELAHGGDVLLDEISELPLNMQVKLLRVLQHGEFVKIGSNKSTKVDVRIIASTNRNLQQMVKEGKFREDLFYRLFVVPIKVPPLRERKEDISILIYHYLEGFNRKNRTNKEISLEAINLMTQYDWPGNVRELINVIERLVITAPANEILPEHLPPQFNKVNANSDEVIQVSKIMPLEEAVQELEKKLINLAIEKLGSSLSSRKIAKLLQISQSSASRRIQKYGIKI
jgi:PAS domain S-box-containing protein